MAVEADLEWFLGEDVTITHQVVPVPTDITGWALAFYLRADFGTAVLLTKTVGSGITITNAAQGLSQISLPRASTQNLAADVYRYEVARVDAGQDVVLTAGTITLKNRVRS